MGRVETQGSPLLWGAGHRCSLSRLAPQTPPVALRVGSYQVPVNQCQSSLPSSLSKGIQEGEEA